MLRICLSFLIFSSIFCAEYRIFEVNDVIKNEVQKAKESLISNNWEEYHARENNIQKYLGYGVHKNYPELAEQVLLAASVKGINAMNRALPLVNKLAPTSGQVLTLKFSTLLSLGMYKESFNTFLQIVNILPQRADYQVELLASIIQMVGKGLVFISILIALSMIANNSEMFLTRVRHRLKSKSYVFALLVSFSLLASSIFVPNLFVLIFLVFASLIVKEIAPLIKYAFLGALLLCLSSFVLPLSKYWFDIKGNRAVYEINAGSLLSKVKFRERTNLTNWISAQVERSKGNFTEASRLLSKNNSSKLPDYINLERGNLAYYNLNYQEADKFYQKAGTFNTASYYYNLSKIKFKLNEVDSSFSYLKNATKLDPSLTVNNEESSETNLMQVEPLPNYLIFRNLIKYTGYGDIWQKPLFYLIGLIAILFFGLLFSGLRNTSDIKSDYQVSTFGLMIAITNVLVPFRGYVKNKKFFLSALSIVFLSVLLSFFRLKIPNINISEIFKFPVIIISGFLFFGLAFLTNIISKVGSGR